MIETSTRAPAFTQAQALAFIELLREKFTVEQLYSTNNGLNARDARYLINLALLQEFVKTHD